MGIGLSMHLRARCAQCHSYNSAPFLMHTGMNNTPPADEARRFGALARLYGAAGAARIRGAHVAVVGLGGVGSWAAEALARSGAARLTLIDFDRIASSNINRQIHALTPTIGQAKAHAMQQRIALIHPSCQVNAIEQAVTPENWPQLLPTPADAVIDACDQMHAKLALAAWALHTGARLVCVGAAGGKLRAECAQVGDLAQATHDRLLARLRAELRRRGITPRGARRIDLPVIFSREAMQRAGENGSAAPAPMEGARHGYGSSVAVTATFGMCAAGWTLNALAAGQERREC